MINYEILSLNAKLMSMHVKYSQEGSPDYYIRVAIDALTEEEVHATAKKQALQATKYWQREETIENFELENLKGQTKRTVVVPAPEYDVSKQKLVEEVIEDENEVRIVLVPVPLTDAELESAIRGKRDALLQQTDAYAFVDRPISEEMLAYREALRNIPQQEGFPHNIVWPIMPID